MCLVTMATYDTPRSNVRHAHNRYRTIVRPQCQRGVLLRSMDLRAQIIGLWLQTLPQTLKQIKSLSVGTEKGTSIAQLVSSPIL